MLCLGHAAAGCLEDELRQPIRSWQEDPIKPIAANRQLMCRVTMFIPGDECDAVAPGRN